MKVLIKKNWGRLVIAVLGLVFTIWLSSILTPIFTKFNGQITEKSGYSALNIVIFSISILSLKVPVYSILVFLFIVWVFYKVYRKYLLSRREFKIVKAKYGSGTKFVNIKDLLNDLVIDNKLNIRLSNGISGFDPTPGRFKIGIIKYKFDDKEQEKRYKENDIVNLP